MFKFFKRKRKPKKDLFEKGDFNLTDIEILESHTFLSTLIYANDVVDIIYPACASCYNISENKNKLYEEKLSYVGRRVTANHTSILEHSNVIVQVYIPLKDNDKYNIVDICKDHNNNILLELSDINDSDQDIVSMISEVRDVCRYLTIHTDYFNYKNELPVMRMTIGGSIRGFRYIFENIENRQNKLFISIFNVLKLGIEPEFFMDFIKDEVFDMYDGKDCRIGRINNLPPRLLNSVRTLKVDIINMDRINDISNLIKLDKNKCLDFVSITVDFKNMSRIITQQVTRHRNGITQESQRYVNYSSADFNSPCKFKDKYDPDKKYNTTIGEFTMDELGAILTQVYGELVTQGVDKEDARGYLPQNVQCGKLFMTFTLRTLFKFLDLRLDPHAQAEVRLYASILADLTKDLAFDLGLEGMNAASKIYSEPIYKREQENDLYSDIDEEI